MSRKVKRITMRMLVDKVEPNRRPLVPAYRFSKGVIKYQRTGANRR